MRIGRRLEVVMVLVLATLACSEERSGEDTVAGSTTHAGSDSTSGSSGNAAGMNPCVGTCLEGTCCEWISGEVGFVDYMCQGGAWVMVDGASCVGTSSN